MLNISAEFQELKFFMRAAVTALCVIAISGCSDNVTSSSQSNGLSSESSTPAPKKKDERPNFLLIVADDLGYADLGVFGGEIGTPNLDALAMSGTQLTNFHTAPTCSPTRAMLFSGTYNHLAGLGVMGEIKHRLPPEVQSQAGYEGHINERVVTLPELLRDAGYRTYMAGKWHLGLEEHSSPHARGFERTYTLLEGGAGHLSNMNVVPFNTRDHALYRENGEMTGVPEDFYSTEFYADKIIEFINEDKHSDKPFMAYLSFTAPHWPLQAPKESIERFKGKYDEGYEVFFERRLARQKELGLVSDDTSGHPLLLQKPWDELSEEERLKETRAMEIYAAMVNDLDTHVGRVIQTLKDTGEYDNTVIFFMSDNGAQNGSMSYMSRLMPKFNDFLARCCDTSIENMGAPNSFVMYGSGWARVSGVPTRFFKAQTTEGGIRSPAILNHPASPGNSGRYDEFLSVMDVMPTFLSLAGVDHPQQYQGRDVLPMKGATMAPILEGQKSAIHPADHTMGWELNNHRALKKGQWKIVMTHPPLGDSTWKLYDLSKDPFEHHDLSGTNPDKLASMLQEWDRYVEENGIFLPK
jgi:arylsulfatase